MCVVVLLRITSHDGQASASQFVSAARLTLGARRGWRDEQASILLLSFGQNSPLGTRHGQNYLVDARWFVAGSKLSSGIPFFLRVRRVNGWVADRCSYSFPQGFSQSGFHAYVVTANKNSRL